MFDKKKLINQLRLVGKDNLFLAYSGGLDSQVLLHLLAELRNEYSELKLTAIHVNHNLSIDAVAWEDYCKKSCAKLCVPIIFRSVDAKIKINKHSPEETARNLRYAAFAELLPKGGCLLTAHHANDQAETLLLQLFRGAGPKGLAAMPMLMPFAQGVLFRPLLTYSRAQLLAYAKKHELCWVEDASNFDSKYHRNFIRHQFLPLIQQNWPGIITTLNRVATNCADATELLEVLAKEDLLAVQDVKQNTLSIIKLSELNNARQQNLLRYWLHQQNLPLPSSAKLKEIQRSVLQSRSDAMPLVSWYGVEVRRYQDGIYAMPPLKPHDHRIILPWDLKKALKLPNDLGILHAEKINHDFIFDVQKISVRFRCGSERCRLSKRHGSRLLAKLFQEWQVPPWQRNRIPLVYYEDEIIAVVGFCTCLGWENRINFLKRIYYDTKLSRI